MMSSFDTISGDDEADEERLEDELEDSGWPSCFAGGPGVASVGDAEDGSWMGTLVTEGRH